MSYTVSRVRQNKESVMKTEINENEVVNGIKVKDWKQFLQLYCAMSPENVCCDGEISRAEANRR